MHIHDLGSLSSYCVGWDLTDLLRIGFRREGGGVRSNPARHFRTALLQAVNFLYTAQGEVAGAIAFSSLDTLLSPFIREDELTYDEIKQSIQEFIFNLNVPTRVGAQAPFTNVTLDLTVPDDLKNIPAIVGGKALDYTYGDLQDEMNLFNIAFAEVLLEGDGDGRPFTFPIPTISLTKDFDWENPAYNPIWELTSKFGSPTFANFINSDLNPSDVRSMCCRLSLKVDDLKYRGGGLFGAGVKTGSVGVVTINLPRIGHIAEDPDEFFEILTATMWRAKDSLEIKRALIEKLTDDGLYPYSAFHLQDVKDATGGYWNNHFSTIGTIGINDTIFNMFGESIMTDLGREFALDILNHMRDVLKIMQKDTGNLYNLEASPAEGACFKLALKDMKKYPDIEFYNIEVSGGDVPYYTNSSHLPADHGLHLFDMMDHQDDLQTLYTGGCCTHVFLGERAPDIGSLKSLIRTIAKNYHTPYFTITPTFSVCKTHSYISGEHELCPECGERTEVYSRVTGYLSPTSRWNDGKLAEFSQRTTYEIGGSAETEGGDYES